SHLNNNRVQQSRKQWRLSPRRCSTISSARRTTEPRSFEAKEKDLIENLPNSVVLDDGGIRVASQPIGRYDRSGLVSGDIAKILRPQPRPSCLVKSLFFASFRRGSQIYLKQDFTGTQ